jgi:hypothetical protein
LAKNQENTETIQKNLKLIEKIIKQVSWRGLCNIWVEYNSTDREYEIRSRTKYESHINEYTKELEFLEDILRKAGIRVYIFTPWFVEECNDEVKFMNKDITLNESVLDRHISVLTKFLIKMFKNREDFSETYTFKRMGEDVEFEFSVKFEEDDEMVDPYDISGDGDMETMNLTIKFNPKDFPKVMNDFVAEIRETITHELEHIGQQNFEDMNVKYSSYENNLEYLTSPQEVPAYVKGLIIRSKSKRQTLENTMEDWFKENKRKFDNPSEDWKIVKKVWMDWAKKQRSLGKIKKFK